MNDCLNNDKHNWRFLRSNPQVGIVVCESCQTLRSATKKEMENFFFKNPSQNSILVGRLSCKSKKKEMEKDVRCPYCDFEQNINHDGDRGYEEGILHHQECCNCEKSFVFTATIIFDYDAKKADCLNDGKHLWGPTITHPKIATKMECCSCGEKRQPTKEEMNIILQK